MISTMWRGKELPMLRLWISLYSLVVVFSISTPSQENSGIVRLDSAVDAIVPRDAKIEKLAGNLVATNGPVWARKGGYLLFSDPPTNIMYKWDPRDSKVAVFLDHSGFTGTDTTGLGREIGSNGTTFDHEGRIVFCAQGDRQIVRLETDWRRTV
jgi:gluconolactonase